MSEREIYFKKLVELMATLRGPNGCPWDREQTAETLKPMLIEEAYEVLEAIDAGDPEELCEELGDLLFQVIFHSRLAEEKGEFDAFDVCRRVYEKMVGRHPHVFGSASIESSKELLRNWESIKADEKKAAGRVSRKKSLLDGVPAGLPALYTAYQVTSKASRVGFDWPEIGGIREKVVEEFRELEEAVDAGDEDRIREEVGDLLFSAVNAARFLEIDPETALRGANRKFIARFQEMERQFEEAGDDLKDVPLEEMEAAWQSHKGGRE